MDSVRHDRSLPILMATMASLASLMLGMGEHSIVLPAVAVFVAASSVYLTDLRGWLRLGGMVSNLVGMAALAYAMWDFRGGNRDNQLLSLANLLIYLQCVLLYREKTSRIYWMLALLGLLQVAVATVLNLSLWFGVLLLTYVFVSLAALSRFLLLRERYLHARAAGATEKTSEPASAASPRARQLTNETVQFRSKSAALPAVESATDGLWWLAARMGAASLAVTGVLFFFVPRSGTSEWGEIDDAPLRTVGYEEETVELGSLGQVAEDPTEVMSFQLFDQASGEPYLLNEVPLLRGSFLMHYENGRWRNARRPARQMDIPVAPSDESELVQQQITVGGLDTRTVFAIFPIFQEREDLRLVYDRESGRLSRRSGRQFRGNIDYTLNTTGLRRGRQLPVVPAERPLHNKLDSYDLLHPYLTEQIDPLPAISRVAHRVVNDISPADTLARARALEIYLRDSGKFRYTLSPRGRNPELDPIEDFLLERPEGHCEYFASALTLMLRSVGIRARMVVGFKGADWNPLRDCYQVRQLHAHTWVEAYLPPEQLPAEVLPPTPDPLHPESTSAEFWRNGGWLLLDPTPGVEGVNDSATTASSWPGLRHFTDFFQTMWSSYVLSMDARRQRDAIYNPIINWFVNIKRVFFDRDAWAEAYRPLWAILRGQWPDGGQLFSWRACLLTIALLTGLLGLYRCLQWLWRLVQRQASGYRPDVATSSPGATEFYRRLESLLGQLELVRSPQQTQREFAHHAKASLAADDPTSGVAGVPSLVAEAYYRVRFGRQALDTYQTQIVEQALDELEAALALTGRKQGPSLA